MNELRLAVKTKMEAENLSLRQLQEITGVSFSSLSRFLRGEDLSWKLFQALQCWVEDKSPEKRRVVMSRRITVNKSTFLVTIEKI